MPDQTEHTGGKKELPAGERVVPVTNVSKIYFPEKMITKGDVIDYYNSMSKYILPYLKNRPMSLKRNPDGIHGEAFYHKHAGENAPSWVQSFESYSDSSARMIDYIVCNDTSTLIYLANLGCIEMNPWNSTFQEPDNPTWIVIDLDPSDGNSFEQVIETALAVKQVCEKGKISSYCKTSGSTGLHIYIPVGANYHYDVARHFAQIIAGAVHELVPAFTSLERNLKKRGNRIYIDFMQNSRGQTLASAYSLRPVEAATVSAPLNWNEVSKGLHPSQFHIGNIRQRVEKIGDLFANVLSEKNDIEKAIKDIRTS